MSWLGFSVEHVYLDGFLACALLDFVYKSLCWTPGVGVSFMLIGLYGRVHRVEHRGNC